MTTQAREVAHYITHGAIALGAAVAVFYAGAMLLLAAAVAPDESMWDAIYVYDYGASEFVDSRGILLDIYARPPLDVWGWLARAAFVVAAWVIVVWGLWLIARVIAGVRRRGGSGIPWLRSGRIALPTFLLGLAVLSAYALAIFLWTWIEWKRWLDAGLTLPGDPKPEPNPAFDSRQIPLGIVTFVAIGALAIVVRTVLRRRELSPSAE